VQQYTSFSCISQLIRYARANSNYSDFLKRDLHLRNRLLDQGYEKIRLIRSLKKFIFRYKDLVEIYSVSEGEAGILLHILGKFMILKLKSSICILTKRQRTSNTITKRKRTSNTITKGKRTSNTMTKRQRTNNDLQNITQKTKQYNDRKTKYKQ
jgi:hypothetical protein